MGRFRVKPGTRVKLSDFDPNDTGKFRDKDEALSKLVRDVERLAALQDRLYAENRRALLVVLQGMDTAGKDGTVKHVFSGVDPTACNVTAFKRPSEIEADHDYLWRIYGALPRRGNVGIFNRSHYEDVLVVRVHGAIDDDEVERRFDQINRFEQLLTETGTRVLKFFLHIDKDEQKRRLEQRLADPEKAWKFSEADVAERRHWNDYVRAYEDAISATSTEWAPWYIVPSNKKWYRNLVVADKIVDVLTAMNPQPPQATVDRRTIRID